MDDMVFVRTRLRVPTYGESPLVPVRYLRDDVAAEARRPLRVLLVEDSEEDAMLLDLELREQGFDLHMGLTSAIRREVRDAEASRQRREVERVRRDAEER